MTELVYLCSICHGKTLFRDVARLATDARGPQLDPNTVYCPHCEMMVEPLVLPAAQVEGEANLSDAGEANLGRAREGGTNAGGSQRGDMSDEGATQWRRDPSEGERNS